MLRLGVVEHLRTRMGYVFDRARMHGRMNEYHMNGDTFGWTSGILQVVAARMEPTCKALGRPSSSVTALPLPGITSEGGEGSAAAAAATEGEVGSAVTVAPATEAKGDGAGGPSGLPACCSPWVCVSIRTTASRIDRAQ